MLWSCDKGDAICTHNSDYTDIPLVGVLAKAFVHRRVHISTAEPLTVIPHQQFPVVAGHCHVPDLKGREKIVFHTRDIQ